MKLPVFIAAITVMFAACNNEKSPEAGTLVKSDTSSTAIGNTSAPAVTDTSITGCFMQLNKRDTATLQLDAKGITITGPLSYNYYEKDRNGGTVQAEMNGNILTGWYLFRSEGVMSVRQVAWKVRKGELWPAYGEMKERSDSAVFTNVDQLTFDSTRPFKKVACTL